MSEEIYLVGGSVRDLVVNPNKKPADYDYVIPCSGFEELIDISKHAGFLPVSNSNTKSGFVEEPDHLGIKALCPELKQVVDIHCARKEFFYSDGAHPDIVEVGTLEEDNSRRDFTCNGLLLPRGVWDVSEIIDFNQGLCDIDAGVLCSIGSAFDRMFENPDQVIRALRFSVKYNWVLDFEIQQAFHNPKLIERVQNENDDRKVKSLNKILRSKSSYHRFFCHLVDFPEMSEAIFSNVGLEATNKKVFQ